jgi:hypothetical protein
MVRIGFGDRERLLKEQPAVYYAETFAAVLRNAPAIFRIRWYDGSFIEIPSR